MLTWAEAFSAGPAASGGKGYNLARLARYGFRVPDGGVLPAESYRLTMADGRKASAIRDGGETNLPESVRLDLRAFLERHGLLNAALAVRSSATTEDSARASFAGIHRSLLNVRGAEEIEQAVLACYASLWTAQARAYRQKMGFADEEVECAVVICRMVAQPDSKEPLCAGVAFSADPRTGRRDRMVIDAVAGLGEAAVSGRVTPRRFVIPVIGVRPDCDESADCAPLASAKQLRELAQTIYRIHWALGDGQDPQDIEWAHDGNSLWIVQSRPVTALPRAGPKDLLRLPQYWSRGNLKDSMPGVLCELSWSALRELVFTVLFASVPVSGYRLEDGPELVRRFHGRAYFDFTLIQWAFFDIFGVPPEQTIHLVGGHQPKIPVPPGDPMKGPDGKRRLKASLRLLRALWGFEKKTAPKFHAYIRETRALAAQPLESASVAELRSMADRVEAAEWDVGVAAGLANSACGRWLTPLDQLMKRYWGARGAALLAALSSGSDGIASAEQGYRVYELARAAQQDSEAREWLRTSSDAQSWTGLPKSSPFRRALASFLEDFGHRCVGEPDAWNPRWLEDPSTLIDLVRDQLAAGVGVDPRIAARERRLAAGKEIRATHPLLWPLIRWMARGLRRCYAIRELGKSALVAGGLPVRRAVLELGRRLIESGELDEARHALDFSGSDLRCWLLGIWDGRGARELTADRRQRREAWLREEAPEVIAGDGGEEPRDFVAQPSAEGEWRGIAVSSGQATGAARIVRDPKSGGSLAAGEILVAPATDPGWTPLFVRASAVVMESGGYLSHGAIVAREFGLPAVVNIPGLLKELQDGETIRVNGDEGVVSRVR